MTTATQLTTTLNNGVAMPLLGLGVYDSHKKEAEQAVTWALETGYRLIDTAFIYHNETETGNAIRQSGIPRKDIFLTSKVWNTDQGHDNTLRAFEASLKKLGCEYLDLYLIHWPVRTQGRETWRALEKLHAEQQIRAIGVSNYTEPFLREMLEYAQIVPAVNQVEFSPYLYLKNLLDECQAKNIRLQAYSPLVRGQRMDDPKLVRLAQKYGKTPAQIIIRWALEHGVSTIPKSANYERIKENFDVFDFQLSPGDLLLMDGFNENLRVVDDPMIHW